MNLAERHICAETREAPQPQKFSYSSQHHGCQFKKLLLVVIWAFKHI